MAISEFEVKRCERELRKFMDRKRPPAHIRAQLDFGYSLSNQSIELYEIRAKWNDPNEILHSPFAKTTFVKTQGIWKIYWKRQDLKWHVYEPVPEVKYLEEFLAVVEKDEHATNAHGAIVKKALIIGTLIVISMVVSCYFGYFYITPSVTAVNASQQKLPSFIVTLPNSRLDFGGIGPGETNTIYYSLAQPDGQYSAMVTTSDGSRLRQTCGAVTKNEIHKRVIITYSDTRRFTCEGT